MPGKFRSVILCMLTSRKTFSVGEKMPLLAEWVEWGQQTAFLLDFTVLFVFISRVCFLRLDRSSRKKKKTDTERDIVRSWIASRFASMEGERLLMVVRCQTTQLRGNRIAKFTSVLVAVHFAEYSCWNGTSDLPWVEYRERGYCTLWVRCTSLLCGKREPFLNKYRARCCFVHVSAVAFEPREFRFLLTDV